LIGIVADGGGRVVGLGGLVEEVVVAG